MAKGAKMLDFKDVLNSLEAESLGINHRFYWGFLEKQKGLLKTNIPPYQDGISRAAFPAHVLEVGSAR